MNLNGIDGSDGIRLDMWLWHARFFKTRILSARCITRGHVRIVRGNSVGGQIFKVRKPHSLIHIGDQLTFTAYDRLIQVEILGLGERRGPASEAQSLYRDISPPVPILDTATTQLLAD